MLLSGHYGPEVGSAMEDELNLLLERLGYRIIRKRNPKPAIDFVARFVGEPIFKAEELAPFATSTRVLRPIFSPEGVTAFSVKKGDVGNSQIAELLEAVDDARRSQDSTLSAIHGQVIVTNHSKTESQLDEMLSKQVFCWDIQRLIFYASKARLMQQRAMYGPVIERCLNTNVVKGTYLAQPNGLINSHTIEITINIFIDDHATSFLLAYDHMTKILNEVYDKYLEPIITDTGYDILTTLSVYVLGLAHFDVAKRAFLDYADDKSKHPKASFAAQPGLQIFQFGAAPWTVLLRV